MAKQWDRKLILTKIEGTEGVDAVPVAASDAFLTRNFQETFLDAQPRTREFERQHFGARPSSLPNRQRGCRFDVDMTGSGGDATDVPKWLTLLRPAGFGVPAVGASAVTQALLSSAIPSATQYYSIDNELAKTLGARANVQFVFEDDMEPTASFEWRGKAPDTLAEDAAQAAATYEEVAADLVSTENTTLSLDSYSPNFSRLMINCGNVLQYKSRVGPQDTVNLRNREMTGELLIEAPSLATKDYYTKVLSRATMPLQLIHGLTAGRIIQLDAPQVELGPPSREDEDGDLMIRFPLRFLPTAAGNDELLLTTK